MPYYNAGDHVHYLARMLAKHAQQLLELGDDNMDIFTDGQYLKLTRQSKNLYEVGTEVSNSGCAKAWENPIPGGWSGPNRHSEFHPMIHVSGGGGHPPPKVDPALTAAWAQSKKKTYFYMDILEDYLAFIQYQSEAYSAQAQLQRRTGKPGSWFTSQRTPAEVKTRLAPDHRAGGQCRVMGDLLGHDNFDDWIVEQGELAEKWIVSCLKIVQMTQDAGTYRGKTYNTRAKSPNFAYP